MVATILAPLFALVVRLALVSARRMGERRAGGPARLRSVGAPTRAPLPPQSLRDALRSQRRPRTLERATRSAPVRPLPRRVV